MRWKSVKTRTNRTLERSTESFCRNIMKKPPTFERNFVPEEIEHKQSLEMWLKEKTNEKVVILNPKRGEKIIT